MEYLDLSPYEYLRSPIPMRSLGWLGRVNGIQGNGRPPMTETDFQLVLASSTRVVNLTLGFHECDFCSTEEPARGNGEYHYYLSDGDVYSAPEMVVHYFQAHGYRLPEKFREALRGSANLEWDHRAARLCDVLADESQEMDLRCMAISDLPNWRDRRAFQALLDAIQDEELVDIAGQEIGRSLAPYLAANPPGGIDLARFPDIVRYGIDLA